MYIDITTDLIDEYRFLSSHGMTPAEAASYLKEGRLVLRTFSETLRRFYKNDDLQSRLTDSFCQDDPKSSPETVSRNIRNWLNGRNIPNDREDIFHIAFALSLTEGQANYLLGQCTDYGIHYRDGKDVIYAWFLRKGHSYTEARDFFLSLPPVPHLKELPVTDSTHITQAIRKEFLYVQDMNELRSCYIRNLDNFGILHLKAFSYFQRYLKQLSSPGMAWDAVTEPAYSLETVMNRYLSLKMPSGKKRSGYSVIQKMLKQNWPNAATLKKICSRAVDVPRKLLLLLYVITENIVDDSYSELDENYISFQDRIENHWYSLNAILTDCGMPLLDARNATDWLILYSITAEDTSMSERMESVIHSIFS